MRLGTRDDEDQGPTRTVVWSKGSETDLGALVAVSVATTICVVSVVCAVELRGVPRVLAVVLAVLSALYAALLIIPMLFVFAGIFIVKGMLADNPSPAQRVSWVVAAVLLGALLGSDAYSVGVPGLLTGPILMAIAIAVLRANPTLSARARRRTRELSGVTAVTALGVGLTIFL